MVEKFLSAAEVCEVIPGMTTSALAQLRFTGKGPRYYKPTARRVLYKESEVVAFIESSARYGTAAEAV